jgi:DNA-binding NarL/FixJ family response regulator
MMAAMGQIREGSTAQSRQRVALVSADLMFESQLGAALRKTGAELVAVRGRALPDGEFDTAFVDLNAETPHRLGLIATLHEQHPGMAIVAFCHHGEKELRTQAMQLGASSCVTNGALQAVALRLAGLRPPPG